jgi:N-acetylmuramoyl-L-alanine amidase
VQCFRSPCLFQRRSLAATAAVVALVALVVCTTACEETTPSVRPAELPEGGPDDVARAEELLGPSTALPKRARVVALTDRLSIAASEDAKGDGKKALLSARLRERVWRFDRSGTDGREAVELYANVVASQAGDAAVSCEADRRRARLLSEMASDATETYRQLFIALKRQTSSEKGDDERRPCVDHIARMLRAAEAFRPRGAAWLALQAEAARIASAQQALAIPLSSAIPAGTGSAAVGAPPFGAGKREVIVVPDDDMVKDEVAQLTDVQPYSWKLGGRVVISLSAPVRYATGVLKPDAKSGRGHRVYLDLLNTRFSKKVKDKLEAGGLIRQVRLGKFKKRVTRVVIDLSEESYRSIFYLPDPFRVVVDVSTRSPGASAKPKSGGKRIVRRVTLDPGHGGWDDGAVGPTGLREKDVALDVAHRAAPALATELGIETMLTRDTDTFIPLEERTARANGFQSDLFISIHCNATENGQANGLEVFVLDPSRERDKAAMGAVHRENRGGRGGKVLDPGKLDAQISTIAAGLHGGTTTQASRLFAQLLTKSTLASLAARHPNTHDHGVKTAGFFVLLGAQMPSVLFETAFISNPDDEARLTTADYRQKLADAIVNAVRAYRDGID